MWYEFQLAWYAVLLSHCLVSGNYNSKPTHSLGYQTQGHPVQEAFELVLKHASWFDVIEDTTKLWVDGIFIIL